MLFKIRSNVYFYYRLFFIALFLLLGITCIGTVVLHHFADITIIATSSDFDKKALHTTLTVMGALGFVVAFAMVFLMRERRNPSYDRRRHSRPLDFTDRRSNQDRRSA